MSYAGILNRPLFILGMIMGVIVLLGLALAFWLERVQPQAVPTLEERRPIDADPTPPDRPLPPSPPVDQHTTPAPAVPAPR